MRIPSRGGETILVVEQEPTARATLCRTLRAEGYQVIAVGRGLETQWCAERQGSWLHLLVAELAAQERDQYHLGIPLTRLLSSTPVIFTSREPRETHVRRGLLHPAAPYLRTPAPPTVIARAVRSVLDRSGAAGVM
ncbi:MAG TPA: response regulator [Gemmatimonadales bacterium]|nr:response regulator [Gemmatimonadales bacterium]